MMASADTKQPNFKTFEIYRWVNTLKFDQKSQLTHIFFNKKIEP